MAMLKQLETIRKKCKVSLTKFKYKATSSYVNKKSVESRRKLESILKGEMCKKGLAQI